MKSMKHNNSNAEIVFSNDNCIFSNATHQDGNITYQAAEPITERYIFGQLKNGKVTPARTGDRAIGIISDTGTEGDLVNLQVMGSGASTLEVVAAANITAGDLITADSSARAIHYVDMPAGNYFIYGIALTDAVAGQTVEFTPTPGVEKSINS